MHELPPPPMSPLTRMTLTSIRTADRPLSLSELSTITGASAVTTMKITQRLVRVGLIERLRSGKISYFVSATEPTEVGS
ncbi:MarR family transcriptional regulator [Edaphobacter sp. HDX4]